MAHLLWDLPAGPPLLTAPPMNPLLVLLWRLDHNFTRTLSILGLQIWTTHSLCSQGVYCIKTGWCLSFCSEYWIIQSQYTTWNRTEFSKCYFKKWIKEWIFYVNKKERDLKRHERHLRWRCKIVWWLSVLSSELSLPRFESLLCH